MTNWMSVALTTVAITAGIEFGRRKYEASGKTYSFVPIWTHRVLTLLLVGSLMTFVEAVKATLNDPSQFHIWLLILSGVAAQFFQAALYGNEVGSAKKYLRR